MPLSTKIPVHKLRVTAIGGIDVVHLYSKGRHPETLIDHRDEYYVLAIVIKGSGVMKCDMGTIPIQPTSILLVKPYQVHSADLIDDESEGYFISIAPFLLPPFCKNIIDNLNVSEQYKCLSALDMDNLLDIVKVLYHAFNTDNVYKVQITINLLHALVIQVCSFFSTIEETPEQKRNQSFLLTQAFKALVVQHSFLHMPSFFAEKLHVASSHLNDCVKATIGLTVTQYLQQSMLLEAKRQLYYTNENVKTIALTLGFEDHTYFSRLFKTLTKETPLTFRSKFRK
jgi:AraC family transcriptional activator of pobA